MPAVTWRRRGLRFLCAGGAFGHTQACRDGTPAKRAAALRSGAELAHSQTRTLPPHATAAMRGVTLASLSAETLREVLVRLPVDARARAAAVCRAWRDLLVDPSLWTRLDLSYTGCVPFTRITNATLRGAAAKARGGLSALYVDERDELTHDALLEVVTANSGALTDLSCLGVALNQEKLEAVLHAAQLLREFRANPPIVSDVAVGRMLRNEPPFGPLRMGSTLGVGTPWPSEETAMRSFATEMSAHPFSQLSVFVLYAPPFEDGAFDALVDVILAQRLKTFTIHELQSVIPASSLAHMLGSKTLISLDIKGGAGNQTQLISGMLNAEPSLTAALRSNTTLSFFGLKATGIFSDAAVAEALIRALTAHPTINIRSISEQKPRGRCRSRTYWSVAWSPCCSKCTATHSSGLERMQSLRRMSWPAGGRTQGQYEPSRAELQRQHPV